MLGAAVSLASLTTAGAVAATGTIQQASAAGRCATAWNGPANAHWRGYARALGSHRAFVQRRVELARLDTSGTAS